jgi:hypothetical protein
MSDEITVEDAKQWIMNHGNVEGIALRARRDFDGKHPVRYTAEREGGGVKITSAEWDFSGWTDQEIYAYALGMDTALKLLLNWKDKPLTEFIESMKNGK